MYSIQYGDPVAHKAWQLARGQATSNQSLEIGSTMQQARRASAHLGVLPWFGMARRGARKLQRQVVDVGVQYGNPSIRYQMETSSLFEGGLEQYIMLHHDDSR